MLIVMRKIKFMLVAVVAIFMVSFIPNVYAEDGNYYELKLYEKNTLLDNFSELELDLLEFLVSKEDLLKLSYEQDKEMVYDLDDKLLFTLNPNGDIVIDDKVMVEDNIEYTFTNEDKTEISEYYPALSSYEGVKLMFAEELKECNLVCIESVVLDSKSDKARILSKPKYQDLTVKFDIKFKELNDYVKYKIVINNATNEDYMISEKSDFGDSPYIIYEYRYEGSNKVVKKNSKKVMYIIIKYNLKVPDEKFNNGVFTENNNLVINLGNDNSIIDVLKNPNTGHNLLIIFIILLVVFGLSFLLYKTTNEKKYLSIFIIGLALLPISIYAIEKFQVNVESKVQIVKLNHFSLVQSPYCSLQRDEDYFELFEDAVLYTYEEGMTIEEWLHSEYNVDNHFYMTKYNFLVSPQLIECCRNIELDYWGERPWADLNSCKQQFKPTSLSFSSLIVNEGLYYLDSGHHCPS